jgi:metal-sulfur cluster biosynthetic enzyme
VDVGAIYDRLCEVIDPELGVNIVDLGLVYNVQASAAGEVEVTMTLTSPGCPLGGYMEDEINAGLRSLAGVAAVRVAIVFDPPWGPEKMSDAGREMLGWFG